VLDTFTYVFVLILSWLVLKEKITRGKLIGNLLIVAGVLIYTMP
ncbi:MAG: EamA family transporter, partial [Lachnospiraceae bacterium]|nr:EamA family transporter [Lachnospiraceae bacterium]